MPGLIDTHWHMWHTLFRGMSGDKREDGFFPTVTRFSGSMTRAGHVCEPRLAAVEAVNAGITSIHSWCHNIRSRAHAEADCAPSTTPACAGAGRSARRSTSRRTRPFCSPNGGDARGLEQLFERGPRVARHGLARDLSRQRLSADGGLQGRVRHRAAARPADHGAYRHGEAATQGHIAGHDKQGLLGPDVNIVHGCSASADEIKMVKDFGASMSILPHTEMRGGWGFPLISEFMSAGVPVGLGIDSSALAGDINLFAVLKFAMAMENGRAGNEFKLTARARWNATDDERSSASTSKPARSPGEARGRHHGGNRRAQYGGGVGPRAPRGRGYAAGECRTVVVDGRILKRGGKLTVAQPAGVAAKPASLWPRCGRGPMAVDGQPKIHYRSNGDAIRTIFAGRE